MKKQMLLHVRGCHESWLFPFYGDPQFLDDWLADGLDVVVVEHWIPQWVAEMGLAKVWCVMQDLFHFKIFKKRKEKDNAQ